MLAERALQWTGKRDLPTPHPKAVEDVARQLRNAGLIEEAKELEGGNLPEAVSAPAPVMHSEPREPDHPVWEPAPRHQPTTSAPVEPIAPNPTAPPRALKPARTSTDGGSPEGQRDDGLGC